MLKRQRDQTPRNLHCYIWLALIISRGSPGSCSTVGWNCSVYACVRVNLSGKRRTEGTWATEWTMIIYVDRRTKSTWLGKKVHTCIFNDGCSKIKPLGRTLTPWLVWRIGECWELYPWILTKYENEFVAPGNFSWNHEHRGELELSIFQGCL